MDTFIDIVNILSKGFGGPVEMRVRGDTLVIRIKHLLGRGFATPERGPFWHDLVRELDAIDNAAYAEEVARTMALYTGREAPAPGAWHEHFRVRCVAAVNFAIRNADVDTIDIVTRQYLFTTELASMYNALADAPARVANFNIHCFSAMLQKPAVHEAFHAMLENFAGRTGLRTFNFQFHGACWHVQDPAGLAGLPATCGALAAIAARVEVFGFDMNFSIGEEEEERTAAMPTVEEAVAPVREAIRANARLHTVAVGDLFGAHVDIADLVCDNAAVRYVHTPRMIPLENINRVYRNVTVTLEGSRAGVPMLQFNDDEEEDDAAYPTVLDWALTAPRGVCANACMMSDDAHNNDVYYMAFAPGPCAPGAVDAVFDAVEREVDAALASPKRRAVRAAEGVAVDEVSSDATVVVLTLEDGVVRKVPRAQARRAAVLHTVAPGEVFPVIGHSIEQVDLVLALLDCDEQICVPLRIEARMVETLSHAVCAALEGAAIGTVAGAAVLAQMFEAPRVFDVLRVHLSRLLLFAAPVDARVEAVCTACRWFDGGARAAPWELVGGLRFVQHMLPLVRDAVDGCAPTPARPTWLCETMGHQHMTFADLTDADVVADLRELIAGSF